MRIWGNDCICEEWFAEGEADHLPDCPKAAWKCTGGHENRPAAYGGLAPVECTVCRRARRHSTPQGW